MNGPLRIGLLIIVGLLSLSIACQAQRFGKTLKETPGMVSYTYRKSFQKDIGATLDTIKAIGITNIEFSNLFGRTAQEIRTPEFVFHPGAAVGAAWTRQPRVPDTPSPYDSADFIPMINDVVDQPLRDAVEPNSSKSEKVGTATITSLHYVLDRSKVPEIAPAIFARAPWLFDVPNATTLTVDVSYDESGVVRHLYLGVDPPQPGTGIDATWVTGYTMDVTSLNGPVAIVVPVDAVDVPVGTP